MTDLRNLHRSEPVYYVVARQKQAVHHPSGGGGGSSVAQAQFDKERAAAEIGANASAAADGNAEASAKLAAARVRYQAAEAALAKAKATPAPPAPPPVPPTTDIDLRGKILSFEYEEDEKKPDLLKLTINNQDLSAFDDEIWSKGTSLFVSWGYVGNTTPVREMIIQSVKGALQLTIEAHGKGTLMNKLARSRVFENMTRSAIVKQVAQENGYQKDEVLHIRDTEVVHPIVTQAKQTDAQFLKRLADIEGFEFFIDFDGLHWHPRDVGQKPTRLLMYYLPPEVGDVVSFSIDNDVTAKPGAIVLKGRDPLKKQDINAVGSNATTPRPTLGTATEIVDPASGKATVEYNTASQDVRTTSQTDPAAVKKEADGQYTRTQQTAVQLTVNMVGDPAILAKTVVEVGGLGKRLSGNYYIKNAKTVINGSGYSLALKTVTDSGGLHKNTGAGAKPNTKKADATPGVGAPPPPLAAQDVVDPATGQAKTVYVDNKGRDVGDNGKA